MDEIVAWLRTLPVNADGQLTQVASDIWIVEAGVGEHVDNTADGLITYGLVLMNDAGLELHYDGKVQKLPVGEVYIIDGRRPHSALPDIPTPGQRLGILVWDAPPGWTKEEFKALALERLADPSLARTRP